MIPILYGSQTGTCAHLSSLLSSHLSALDVPSFYRSIDAFNILEINNYPLIIFICSTHGYGQPTFNMSRFWNVLRRDIPSVFTFRFAILCVGDSSYERYNWCGKILGNRLVQLGAQCVLKVFADSQSVNGCYDGYNEFKSGLQSIIRDIKSDAKTADDAVSEPDHMSCSNAYSARILSNRTLTASGYQPVVFELVLNIPSYNSFLPGDCIGFYPHNTSMPEFLAFGQEQIEFIKKNVDLNGILRQPKFGELARCTSNALYKEKLLEIANDYDTYYSYVVVPRRTITEVLEEFRISPPFEFFSTIERIHPRYYSCSKIGDNYHVLVNYVFYKTSLEKERVGLSSEYLFRLRDEEIRVDIVNSSLCFEGKKLLFFSTGTGVTLPRSVLHYLTSSNNLLSNEIRVYHGFRHYNKDSLITNEFSGISGSVCTLEYYPAASRDSSVYVMDVYRNNPVDDPDEWLIFVSGHYRLNKEIKKVLKEVHGKEIDFQSETW